MVEQQNKHVTTTIIDGKSVAQEIQNKLTSKIYFLKTQKNIQPTLATILVGDNQASIVYKNYQKQMCNNLNMNFIEYNLPEKSTEEEVVAVIIKLNATSTVHGILLLVPLPRHLNQTRLFEKIAPQKDIDCCNPFNRGMLLAQSNNAPFFLPATCIGIIKLLEYYEISLTGQNVVVIGASEAIGKPLGLTFLTLDATVTICSIHTKNLKHHTLHADVIVIAIGNNKFLKRDMVRENAVIIDVGINPTKDGKLEGDVDYAAMLGHVDSITPVPGGVGPMTGTMLLRNTIKAAKREASTIAATHN